MLATRTDDQLLRWKEVAEIPRIDNYNSITIKTASCGDCIIKASKIKILLMSYL